MKHGINNLKMGHDLNLSGYGVLGRQIGPFENVPMAAIIDLEGNGKRLEIWHVADVA
jgi:hypothetical protein